MHASRFEHTSHMPASTGALWSLHLRADALGRLTPPGLGFRVDDPGDGVADGSVLRASMGWGPLRQRWVALHAGVEPGQAFMDIALQSPFPYWVHQHSFEPSDDGCCRLRDVVWFVPPAWLPGAVGARLVGLLLAVLFRWRHWQTRRMLGEMRSDAPGEAGRRGRAAGPGSRQHGRGDDTGPRGTVRRDGPSTAQRLRSVAMAGTCPLGSERA